LLGELLGMAKGTADGKKLGAFEGALLGIARGLLLGELLGMAEGMADGKKLGYTEGQSLGDALGPFLGELLGLADMGVFVRISTEGLSAHK